MPNEQYFLKLVDSQYASLDTATTTVTGVMEGTTTLHLMDRNLNHGYVQASSDVHVTQPAYLRK